MPFVLPIRLRPCRSQRVAPFRWFAIVSLIAVPVCAGGALWSLSSHSIVPAAVAGALVIGAAFGRPGSAANRRASAARRRASLDYALLAMGAAYIGVMAGMLDYANH